MNTPKKQLWPKVASLQNVKKSDDYYEERPSPVVISVNVSVRRGSRKDSATTEQRRSMKPVPKKIICEDFPRARSQVRTTRSIVEMEGRIRAQLSREIQQGIELEIEKQIVNLTRKLEEMKTGGGCAINEGSNSIPQRNRCILSQDRVKHGQKRRDKRTSKKGSVGDLVNKMYVTDSGCCSRNTYAAMVFAAKLFKRKHT
ncbi:hypothetical protein SUGI_1170470 [Cryptomeria japonica]|nr:hypothetical protein SUGI_1170470 [Cryptomeria japonica]